MIEIGKMRKVEKGRIGVRDAGRSRNPVSQPCLQSCVRHVSLLADAFYSHLQADVAEGEARTRVAASPICSPTTASPRW